MNGDNNINLNSNVTELPDFVVWAPVKVEWKIFLQNNFPLYTHIIQQDDGINFWLKSTSHNLNDYTGYLEIEGHIDTIVKSLPVLVVDTIKIPDSKLIIENNVYFFVEDLLKFDFGQHIGFGARKDDWEIIIFFNDNDLIKIERFICNKVTTSQNCQTVLMDLKYSAADNFNSYYGSEFYRYKSGWITFNKDMFGYIFHPVDDDTLLDISNVMTIITLETILSQKEKIINAQCKNDTDSLNRHISTEVSYDDAKIITLILKWKNQTNFDATCMISFDLRNSRDLDKVNFYINETQK